MTLQKIANTRKTVSAPSKPLTSEAPIKLERYCSVARTVEILSDAWSFLVLREVFFGSTRFEQFQSVLGLPRNTLAKRLKKLTDLGLLRTVRYSSRPVRYEYRFTDKGRDLYPSMLALLKFGDTWLGRNAEPPLQLIHNACGKHCSPIIVCSSCNGEVDAQRVFYRDGPGAGSKAKAARRRTRRASDPAILERGRPCSVARTLQVIGDRWSFLVIREAFFGVHRYDEFQSKLGIATNILADRLQRLTDEGLLDKKSYMVRPERFEYRFTEKGRDIYGPLIVMMRWGDKWVSDGKPPLLLRHRDCGKDFSAIIACDQCRKELLPHDMSYELRYTLDAS
jgi:DNA-binding HxlR family transcriptional regulator